MRHEIRVTYILIHYSNCNIYIIYVHKCMHISWYLSFLSFWVITKAVPWAADAHTALGTCRFSSRNDDLRPLFPSRGCSDWLITSTFSGVLPAESSFTACNYQGWNHFLRVCLFLPFWFPCVVPIQILKCYLIEEPPIMWPAVSGNKWDSIYS